MFAITAEKTFSGVREIGAASREAREAASEFNWSAKFTAADISVGYALELAQQNAGIVLGEAEQAYVARLRQRPGYQRALATCHATRTWWAS